jgi:hypothetical protein
MTFTEIVAHLLGRVHEGRPLPSNTHHLLRRIIVAQIDDLLAAQNANLEKLTLLASAVAALEATQTVPTDLSGAIASETAFGDALDKLTAAATPAPAPAPATPVATLAAAFAARAAGVH